MGNKVVKKFLIYTSDPIKNNSIMMPFLEKIADRLLKKFPKGMDGIAVVLPFKRSVVFLKHYLSQKIDRPIFHLIFIQ